MIILKIGGGESINVEGVASDIAELSDEKFIIVHGANAYRDKLAKRLNYEKQTITSVSGYSSVFTDDDALDIQMMAYAGVMNKKIVSLLQQKGINAVGLSGIDGRVIQGKRNTGIRIRENNKMRIVRDHSGKPQSINSDLLNLLTDNGFTPVLTVPIIDEKGKPINSENDDIVAVIQNSIKADKVIQLIEAPGLLEDKDDDSTLIKNLTVSELQQREEKVEGRMKRKLLALTKLFEGGAAEVIIADGRNENPVKNALANNGTVIK